MRGVAAIIEPAVDIKRLTKQVSAAHVALQDAERAVVAAESRAGTAKDEAARCRFEVGRLLVEAKANTKHGEWLPFLESQGIDERCARNWMSVAAAEAYSDWLVGRNLSIRDLSPAYGRLKGIFAGRLEQETGKKPLLPQPAWASNHTRGVK